MIILEKLPIITNAFCTSSFFQVYIFHTSISLCSMTLQGIVIASKLSMLSPWVTLGILSTSLSGRS